MSTRRVPETGEPRVRAEGHRHVGPPDQRKARLVRRTEQHQAWVARNASAGFNRRSGRGR